MKKLLILFAAVLMLVSAGCSDAASPAASPDSPSAAVKNELTMALAVDPDGLDPQRTTAASTFQITNNLYEPLLKVDTQGNLTAGLAETWSLSDDGLSVIFTLRENALFSNGRPCDSEAVIASFERLLEDGSPRASDYAGLSSMEAVDERTVRFATETLNVALLSSFAYPWAAIVDVSEADTLKNKPVGTGPYTLESWIPQQALSLKQNPDYPGTVNIETIQFKMMPDAASQISAFQNNELDIISVSGDQVAAFENNPSCTVVQAPANSLQLMAMNLENEALSDIRVRQAINYAVDKDQLIDTVWWGYGQKIGSHYPTVLKEYIDTGNTYAYDPEKARDLLKQAGYENGLTLDMVLPKNYTAYVNAGQVIADQLKAVGITCKITIVEWAAWLSDVYTGRQYDLTVVGHTGRLDPIGLLARYQSDSAENYFNYHSAEVDQLLTDYKTETEESRRTQLIQQVQQILAAEVPALYIQDPISVYVLQKGIEGFASYPIDVYEMKDVRFAQ